MLRKCRKLNSVDRISLASDVEAMLSSTSQNDLPCNFDHYHRVVAAMVDRHAPVVVRRTREHTVKPWYSEGVHKQRMIRRKLERHWQKTRLTVHHQMYEDQSVIVINTIKKAKADYYQGKLASATPRDMFRVVKELVSRQEKVLPITDSHQSLADRFVEFFHQKVDKIRRHLDDMGINSETSTIRKLDCVDAAFSSFSAITDDELLKIISKSAAKSCVLDPVATWLLKEPALLQAVLPTLTTAVNYSLTSGNVPECLKKAVITPLIKKAGLDSENLKNYRPVSNLPFVGKILEKVVAQQLSQYLQQNGLNDKFQSAYRREHSTESALLRIKNDFDVALDAGDGVLLVLLDLSAAFDTIDHEILLDILESQCGITGVALKWMTSYLSGRTQSVIIGEACSRPVKLRIGVPQGSVLGPLLFSVYIAPLSAIMRKYGISYHGYADDTSLYVRFNPKEPGSLVAALWRLEACLEEIRAWMVANKLMLNEAKTDFFDCYFTPLPEMH